MPPQSPPETPVPAEPAAAPSPQGNYDFIMNPQKPARRPLLSKLPAGSSLPARIAYIFGGLLILLIIFIFVKGLFGGSNFTSFVGIVQDQQEMIHLAASASQQQNLTVGDQNFAATAKLSLSSSQSAIIKYLVGNGQKLNTKTLNLKVSAATDQQLQNSLAAATYDQTFQQIMNGKLKAYVSDLKQTYTQTTGKNGRALLNDDYKQAQLLLTQLNSVSQ